MTHAVRPSSWDQLTAALAERVQHALAAPKRQSAMELLRSSIPPSLAESTCRATWAERIAEAILCVRVVHSWLTTEDRIDVAAMYRWLQTTTRTPFREIFQAAIPSRAHASSHLLADVADAIGRDTLSYLSQELSSPGARGLQPADRVVQSYERLLVRNNRRRRGTYGIYYTPRSVTSHIVRSTHTILRDEFALPDGLAHTTPSVLDPAMGTGAFLVAVIDHAHRHLMAKWTQAGYGRNEQAERWTAHVTQCLLPHLRGWEIMLPAATLAHLAIGCQLASTGFDFQTEQPLLIHWKDALAAPRDDDDDQQVTVILGNPPYSALSTTSNDWITELLHGNDRGCTTHDYFEVAGESLGERKVWLHDDYVKFLRIAHRLLDRSGHGVLAFITNRGYLDNLTFRGVRYQLLQTFDRISIVDLHGGRKAREQTPTGETDENIFDIEQGVAIGYLRRGGKTSGVDHIDVWGSRAHKDECLARHDRSELAFRPVAPQTPHFHLVPRDAPPCPQYQAAAKLTCLMPIHTTAPVTARDGFVVAFTEYELMRRLEQFADLSISDARIRATFFTNGRSRRYLAGDTRGWKLTEARRRMARETDLRSFVRDCWYRPFDRRKIFWADWMIDWPRQRVMQSFDRNNLALVARRQMLATRPCNYFWVIDDLALDGLIRSDNRGSESIFPLYVSQAQATNLDANSPLASEAPETALHYIYALFHCTSYRSRYAAALRRDFPRVPLPRDDGMLPAFARIGKQLIDLHLLRSAEEGDTTWCGGGRDVVGKGYPQHRDQRVYLNGERWLAPVSSSAWDFHVGGHQVACKWLKDRRGRVLQAEDTLTYQRIVHALSRTLSGMDEIEQTLAECGTIDDVFQLADHT